MTNQAGHGLERNRVLVSVSGNNSRWIALLVWHFLIIGFAIAGVPVQPPTGPVPQVQAWDQVPSVAPSFAPNEDEPAERPNHPPIDQIPPIPMSRTSSRANSSTPGRALLKNAITGEVTAL